MNSNNEALLNLLRDEIDLRANELLNIGEQLRTLSELHWSKPRAQLNPKLQKIDADLMAQRRAPVARHELLRAQKRAMEEVELMVSG